MFLILRVIKESLQILKFAIQKLPHYLHSYSTKFSKGDPFKNI